MSNCDCEGGGVEERGIECLCEEGRRGRRGKGKENRKRKNNSLTSSRVHMTAFSFVSSQTHVVAFSPLSPTLNEGSLFSLPLTLMCSYGLYLNAAPTLANTGNPSNRPKNHFRFSFFLFCFHFPYFTSPSTSKWRSMLP